MECQGQWLECRGEEQSARGFGLECRGEGQSARGSGWSVGVKGRVPGAVVGV